MREWADVYLQASATREKLERKAVFFVPQAFDFCNRTGLSPGVLSAFLKVYSFKEGQPVAGRAAVRQIWEGLPVKYASAIGFINLVNTLLETRSIDARLTTADIIACVFRLRDAPEVAALLQTNKEKIASETKLSVGVVSGALERYRLPYNDAHKLWEHLLSLKVGLTTVPKGLEVLTEREHEFIVVEIRTNSPVAVLHEPGQEARFVYSPANLTPAPRTGHHWAIDPAIVAERKSLPPSPRDEGAKPGDSNGKLGDGGIPMVEEIETNEVSVPKGEGPVDGKLDDEGGKVT